MAAHWIITKQGLKWFAKTRRMIYPLDCNLGRILSDDKKKQSKIFLSPLTPSSLIPFSSYKDFLVMIFRYNIICL